jgi:hypothetical protein
MSEEGKEYTTIQCSNREKERKKGRERERERERERVQNRSP